MTDSPNKKRTRATSPQSPVSPPDPVTLPVNTWNLPSDEGSQIMNYVLHHKLYRCQLPRIILVTRFAKSTVVYSHENKRWSQAFPFNYRVNVHWKGIDFEMERVQINNKSMSLLPNTDENDMLQISSTATITKLNSLIKVAEDYEQSCIAEGIQQSIMVPTEEGDMTIQNVSPFVNMKDVVCPMATKKALEAGMKNMESDSGIPGQPKRFVPVIYGQRSVGKTTIVRALATSFKKKLVQFTCTNNTTTQDLIMLLEDNEGEASDTLFVLRDAEKLMTSIDKEDFDVLLFSRLINGLLTPPTLYLIIMMNTNVEPKLKSLECHITHIVHVPLIKIIETSDIVSNIMKKRRMLKNVDGVNELITKSMEGKTEIKCGLLVNAVVNYDETQKEMFCKRLGQKSQSQVQHMYT
jgi:hypothetical protein